MFRTRDGGSFSTRRVTALQFDQEIFVMSASFKVPEDGLDHAAVPHKPPSLPEDCPRLAYPGGALTRTRSGEKEWAALDTRFVGFCTVARPTASACRCG